MWKLPRAGFRLYWRWKSKSPDGRPKLPFDIRTLIREISLANPLWGAPRIHGEPWRFALNREIPVCAGLRGGAGRSPTNKSAQAFCTKGAGKIAPLRRQKESPVPPHARVFDR
jgi:hypothetical protein